MRELNNVQQKFSILKNTTGFAPLGVITLWSVPMNPTPLSPLIRLPLCLGTIDSSLTDLLRKEEYVLHLLLRKEEQVLLLFLRKEELVLLLFLTKEE